MMKQKYFLILGIISIVGIILISGCIQQGKMPLEGWSTDFKLLTITGTSVNSTDDVKKLIIDNEEDIQKTLSHYKRPAKYLVEYFEITESDRGPTIKIEEKPGFLIKKGYSVQIPFVYEDKPWKYENETLLIYKEPHKNCLAESKLTRECVEWVEVEGSWEGVSTKQEFFVSNDGEIYEVSITIESPYQE